MQACHKNQTLFHGGESQGMKWVKDSTDLHYRRPDMISSSFPLFSSLLSRTRRKIGIDPAAIQRMTIGRAIPDGMIDSLQVESAGVIRVEGWHAEAEIPSHLLPNCRWNEQPIPLSQVYRTWRPDVSSGIHSANRFMGFECLFVLPDLLTHPGRATVTVACANEPLFSVTADFQMSVPHYRHLLTTADTGHREHIYGVGPPPATVLPEVLDIALSLPDPVLDFGCGSGALVNALRVQGKESVGLELRSNPFLASLLPDVKPHVMLYDGSLPLPFADGQFQSAIAVEVLEHIADYESIVGELARVAVNQVVFTVPDISAIPMGFHQRVVPWHLLEATHINFFTQPALETLLHRHFTHVDIVRIGPTIVNNTKWFCSLIALCRKSIIVYESSASRQ
jgi:SAM-dependent methyltransferase